MITALIFIAILAVLVLIHEFGHFIAAKKNGVLVEEFGFGFPPRLFGIKKGETLYSFNALPIGGFVKVYGEEYYEEDAKVDPKLKDRAFVNKKPWQKTLIITAGVIMNFLLGWVIISYLFTSGIMMPKGVAVAQVQPGSPAQQVGLKKDDVLVKIIKDGKDYPINLSTDLISTTQTSLGKQFTLVVYSKGVERQVTVTPRKNPPKGQGALGVVLKQLTETKQYPWYSAPFYGLLEAAHMTKQIFVELGRTLMSFITFQQTKVDVTGPVGIAQYVGEARKYGINAILELVALLSLNLAVINILPFPALDGGRLVFIVYEWITKRRVNKNFERYMNLIGIIILLSLSALITVKDIARIWPW